ncbi:sortase-dependent protein [Streptomyces gamaensis]|uniref:Sortase-dependent protein n=1 Tax=Streptomyces gamaensis TaxID=1763542 RepID=A0ABW0YZQ5_9ACTN
MKTTRSSRTALRATVATAVLAGAVALPATALTPAFAADARPSGGTVTLDAGPGQPPRGGVAAGEAPEQRPDSGPAIVGGALAAAAALGGVGLLATRRRPGTER